MVVLACVMLCAGRAYAATGTATWDIEQNSAGQITSVKLDMSSMPGYTQYLVNIYLDDEMIVQQKVTTPTFDVTEKLMGYDSGEFRADGFAYKSGASVQFASSEDLKFYTITIDKQGHGNNVKINHLKAGTSVKTAVKNAYINTFDAGGDDMLMRYFEDGDAFMGVALKPLSNYANIDALKSEACYLLPGGSGQNYNLGGNVKLYDIWFKVINRVELTVGAPACGNSASPGANGPDNSPSITIPSGAGYHFASSGNAPKGSWIQSIENHDEAYVGGFVGGNSYAFQTHLISDFGYVFPTDNDTVDLAVTVNGTAVPRTNAFNDAMPYSFAVIGNGTVPLFVDGTVTAAHVEVVDPEVPATCTTDGLTAGSHCSGCNEVLQAQSVIPGGHKWSEDYVVDVEPTCTDAGSQHKVCTVCQTDGDPVEIQALGHKEVANPGQPATLTDDGMTGGTHCDRCGIDMSGPAPISHPASFTLSAKSYVYNGTARKPAVTVKDAEGNVVAASNYKLSYAGNTNAGTASATITFNGVNYKGAKKLTYKINKASNPLTIKAKSATVKYAKLKKKAQTLAVSKVIAFTKKGQGKIAYGKVSGNKKITINKTTGKVTLGKGLKKGAYKVKVRVKAAGNANYNASAWKTVTFKVVVK